MKTMEQMITVTSSHHGLANESIIMIHEPHGQRFIGLFTRPRVSYVTELIDSSTFKVDERRMTWGEWMSYVASLLIDIYDDEIKSYENELISTLSGGRMA